MSQHLLPTGVQVFERGWLSANNVLLQDETQSWLVDTGYVIHAEQTLALVQHALNGRALNHIVNSHIHSDHCGGNAHLQLVYPGCETWVPKGNWVAVTGWHEHELNFGATGQVCPRFAAQHSMQVGDELCMANLHWQVMAAGGHDNDAVLLFEPQHKLLIAGDAIWGNGLSVVFPEIAQQPGFDDVAATLRLIESLKPALIIPGHGPLITDPAAALAQSHSRLAHYRSKPDVHALYAAKVLLKFHLLAVQRDAYASLMAWMADVPLLQTLHEHCAPSLDYVQWCETLIGALVKSGAAKQVGSDILNS